VSYDEKKMLGMYRNAHKSVIRKRSFILTGKFCFEPVVTVKESVSCTLWF